MESKAESDPAHVVPADNVDPSPPRAPSPPSRGVRRAGIVAVVVALLVGLALYVGRPTGDATHAARGVHVGGVDVSGADEAQVREAAEVAEKKLARRRVRLVWSGRELYVEPEAVALKVDRDATVQAVFETSRTIGFWRRLAALGRPRVDVAPRFVWDEGLFEDVAREVERELVKDLPSDGGIRLEGETPRAELPKDGYRLQRERFGELLKEAFGAQHDGSIAVPAEHVASRIDPATVEAATREVAALVEADVVLVYTPSAEEIAEAEERRAAAARKQEEEPPVRKKKRKRGKKRDAEEAAKPPPEIEIPGPVDVRFDQKLLVSAVRAHVVGDPPVFEASLDPQALEKHLAGIKERALQLARDATFVVDAEDKVSIVPSRNGARVDPERVASALFAASKMPGRRGDLPVERDAPPKLTTEDAGKLGIVGLVAKFTTRHPCCQPRVVNIHRIADMLDGTIVPAGQRFSVNEAVGPRTVARGFLMAPSIGDGEMVDTVGGGISQFATTLFNALFDGGYAIKERKAHSFYFHRYPMGIEATLSFPSPDLAFENDTAAGMLIKTVYGRDFITVKIFGDNGGRKVERKVSGVSDITDPKVEYEANDKLDPEEEKVVERGSHGWSVWVSRIITMPSGEKKEEKRKVTYNPRPRLVRVHSCKIPKDEPGHTGKACPKSEKTPEELEEAKKEEEEKPQGPEGPPGVPMP